MNEREVFESVRRKMAASGPRPAVPAAASRKDPPPPGAGLLIACTLLLAGVIVGLAFLLRPSPGDDPVPGRRPAHTAAPADAPEGGREYATDSVRVKFNAVERPAPQPAPGEEEESSGPGSRETDY